MDNYWYGSSWVKVTENRLELRVGRDDPDTFFAFDFERGYFGTEFDIICPIDEVTGIQVQRQGPKISDIANYPLTVQTNRGEKLVFLDRSQTRANILASQIADFLAAGGHPIAESFTRPSAFASDLDHVPRIPGRAESAVIEQEAWAADAVKQNPFSQFPRIVWLAFVALFVVIGLLFFALPTWNATAMRPGQGLLLAFVSLVFVIGGSFMFRYGLRPLRRTQAIYAAPVPLRVRVTAITNVVGWRYVLEYRYFGEDDRLYNGQSNYISMGAAQAWHPGDTAHIVVNRDNPTESRLVSTKPIQQEVTA